MSRDTVSSLPMSYTKPSRGPQNLFYFLTFFENYMGPSPEKYFILSLKISGDGGGQRKFGEQGRQELMQMLTSRNQLLWVSRVDTSLTLSTT